jgi:hypothetical protein
MKLAKALLKLKITNDLLPDPIYKEMIVEGATVKGMLDPMLFTKKEKLELAKYKKVSFTDKYGSLHEWQLIPDIGVESSYS